jgi:hypothetical protein
MSIKNLVLFIALFLVIPSIIADSSGWNFPTKNSVLHGAGWASPTNAYSDNAAYATASASALNATNYTGFTLGVPDGATINNIFVRVAAKAGSNSGTNVIGVRAWNGSQWGTLNQTGDYQTTLANQTLTITGLTWTNNTIAQLRLNVSADNQGQRLDLDSISLNVSWTNMTRSTCTYGGSGNWAITGGDYCNITTNAALTGNITCNGTGILRLQANLTGIKELRVQVGCNLTMSNNAKISAT